MKENIGKYCEFSEEGLKTFKKERHGVIIGESKNKLCYWVQWRGSNYRNNYHKSFIKISAINKIMTDKEPKTQEKEISTDILSESIVRIGDAFLKLQQNGLNKKAIIVLIRDYTGLSKRDIESVIDSLSKLRGQYCNK